LTSKEEEEEEEEEEGEEKEEEEEESSSGMYRRVGKSVLDTPRSLVCRSKYAANKVQRIRQNTSSGGAYREVSIEHIFESLSFQSAPKAVAHP